MQRTLRRRDQAKIAARVIAGCAKTASDHSLRVVSDLLGIGNPVKIRKRDVVGHVLNEHTDLTEMDTFLNDYYPMGDSNS